MDPHRSGSGPPTSMSQLMAIRLEVLGLLLVPFLSLAVIEACGFIRPTRLNLWKKAE